MLYIVTDSESINFCLHLSKRGNKHDNGLYLITVEQELFFQTSFICVQTKK